MRDLASSQELPASGDFSYAASAASSVCLSASESSPRSCQVLAASSSSLACTSARSSGLRRASSARISALLMMEIVSSEGQGDEEIRPLADLAADADGAVVFLGDAFGHGQADAGAAFLGRVVSLENPRDLIRLNPGARVDDIDDRLLSLRR